MTSRPVPATIVAATVVAAVLAGLTVLPHPASAQAERPPADEPGEFDAEALKRRLDEAWDRMMDELGPTLDSLGTVLDTFEKIDGIENYEKPEILPNGDILLRRRPDAPPLELKPEEPEAPPPGGAAPGIKT